MVLLTKEDFDFIAGDTCFSKLCFSDIGPQQDNLVLDGILFGQQKPGVAQPMASAAAKGKLPSASGFEPETGLQIKLLQIKDRDWISHYPILAPAASLLGLLTIGLP